MPQLKRRQFLIGSAGAVGALVVGWAAAPLRQRLLPSEALTAGPGQVALNGWVKVDADNGVTLMMSQVEMGQGSHTGLAMLLVDEMDADWEHVRFEQAGADAIYNNQSAIIDALPLFQPDEHGILRRATEHVVRRLLRAIPDLSETGGSSSITDQWLPLRQAGAAARAMLIAAAAARWAVPAGECRAESGRVLHRSGKSATFGELALEAARLPLPQRVTLKEPSQYRLIGKPVRRLDNAAKLDGSATFGIDALPAGLLYAGITMCPTLGGTVRSFDATRAQQLPGVRRVVALAPVAAGLVGTGSTSGGVAVIADSPFHAFRALERLAIEWDHGAAARTSSESIAAELTQALDSGSGKAHLQRGDAEAALESAARSITADYRVPFLAHATMEPMNCTAQLKDGVLTVWAATQASGFARRAIAKALDMDPARIVIHVPFLGCGFGRRYLSDVIVQAAALARETGGAPVQLIWSREQDMAHDYYRPAYVSRYRAGFDAQDRLIAWQATSAGSNLGAPSFLDNSTDGASNTAYAFPNVRVAHRTVEPGVPVGIWRSVNHSQNAFFTESFVDECAFAVGRDPVAFRASLLAGNERHLRVLHRAAELANWSRPAASGADGLPRARGIAIHRAFGSVVAQVAELSVTAQRRIRVQRVVCVIDCGFAVNPNLIRQQMEGAIIFGLSAALYGEITLDRGQVQQGNFDDYAAVRMAECPVIEVDIIPSDAPPAGVGESGTPPIAPAVANALFALTGRRARSLPLRLA